jgi:ABC-type transport system involved in multi-copper enzyme maturation permease subunit
MRNKASLLTTVGIIFLVIGVSFLVGTIYRSFDERTTTFGALEPGSDSYRLFITDTLPPREGVIEGWLSVPVDVHILDSNGVEHWTSEGLIKSVLSAKNVSSAEAFSVKLPSRGSYGILLVSPENFSITGELTMRLYGCESDLLFFSAISLVVGLGVTVASKSIFARKEKQSAIVKLKKTSNKDFPSTEGSLSDISKSVSVLDSSRFGSQLRKLLVWEFEEYLAFPMLEIIVMVAILTVLTPRIIETLPVFSYENLLSGIQPIFLFLIFVVGVLFCHSYAGSISKGEMKMILSYPVHRSKLFLSKFITLFSILFVVYTSVFMLQIPLLSLNFFEPMLYVSVLIVGLHIFLVCTISTALSLVTKNEVLSILASVLLLFGIESIASMGSLVTFTSRFTAGFNFVRQCVHGVLSSVSVSEVLVSVFVVLGVSVLLFVFSYVYFTRKMEID